MDVTPKSAGIENFGAIEFFPLLFRIIYMSGKVPITDDMFMSSP